MSVLDNMDGKAHTLWVVLIHTVYGQGYVLRAPEPEEDRPT